jgi:hypothetical protein
MQCCILSVLALLACVVYAVDPVVQLAPTDPDALETANFAVGNCALFYHGSIEEVSFRIITATKQNVPTGVTYSIILEATDNALTVPVCTVKQFGVLIKFDNSGRVTADATLGQKCVHDINNSKGITWAKK